MGRKTRHSANLNNQYRKRIIQCPKVNGAHLRVAPPNQVSQNPRNPNKSAEGIGKIPETQQIGETNRRSRPNAAADWGGGGGHWLNQRLVGRDAVPETLVKQVQTYGRVRTHTVWQQRTDPSGLSSRIKGKTGGLRYTRTSVERQSASNCGWSSANGRRLSANLRRLRVNRRRLHKSFHQQHPAVLSGKKQAEVSQY